MRKLWIIALICWFALTGLLMLTNIQFEASHLILGLLALAVAILAALDR